jgi:hypothetical protein
MFVCISVDITVDEIKNAYPIGMKIDFEGDTYKVVGYLDKRGYNGIEIEPIKE